MKKPRVTIVGLGLIGSSMGLALKARGGNYEIVGHDREPIVSKKSRKMGAVDSTDWNLINACDGADLIMLALPLAAIRGTLEAIAPYLKPGCIITDTATLKRPVLSWATELLPDAVSFVGGDPVLAPDKVGGAEQGVEAASATLLQGAQYCLTPSTSADPSAVHVVTDMVSAMGAEPYFLDATEHDGLLAGIDHLPVALGAALMQTTLDAPSWSEMRRLAGDAFAAATGALGDDPASLASLLVGNRENLLRLISQFQERLEALHEVLGTQDEEGLQQLLSNLMEARDGWIIDRARGNWEERHKVEMPSKGAFVGSLLGFGGSRAARRREKDQ